MLVFYIEMSMLAVKEIFLNDKLRSTGSLKFHEVPNTAWSSFSSFITLSPLEYYVLGFWELFYDAALLGRVEGSHKSVH